MKKKTNLRFSAACFELQLFMWFRLESSSRLSCCCFLLNRAITFWNCLQSLTLNLNLSAFFVACFFLCLFVSFKLNTLLKACYNSLFTALMCYSHSRTRFKSSKYPVNIWIFIISLFLSMNSFFHSLHKFTLFKRVCIVTEWVVRMKLIVWMRCGALWTRLVKQNIEFDDVFLY